MNILITGAKGFIGRNLISYLESTTDYNLIKFNKNENELSLKKKVLKSDIIFHLAGVNRENNKNSFLKNNILLTKKICSFILKNNKKIKLIFASSTQAIKNNFYGVSKKKSERIILQLKKKKLLKVYIFRLPNVFGKWSKPFFNSVIATFCFLVARKKNIDVYDKNRILKIVYIDDVIQKFVKIIKDNTNDKNYYSIKKIYRVKVKRLAKIIKSFDNEQKNFLVNNISIGLTKKLYSTYLSFLPTKNVVIKLRRIRDKRGDFIELIKNKQFGQISYFSILPKKIRGEHFHHTKTEKFFLISGKVRFNFVNVTTKKKYSILVNDNNSIIVSTVPGWAHNIENIGNKLAKLIVWSNEIFNLQKHDTHKHLISKR
jgi:UDP-2-acetamido-2,6-beta-L-arabino-hexul-4-ose reductase